MADCKCGTPGCSGPPDRDFIESCLRTEGWAGMGVMGDPGFNYTIGLTDRGAPELLVIGLPYRSGHFLLGNAIGRLADIRHGAILDGIAEGFQAAFVEVPQGPANADYLIQASHFYGRDVPVLQMVWPDPKGLFPWDPGCVPSMAEMQCGVIDLRISDPTRRH